MRTRATPWGRIAAWNTRCYPRTHDPPILGGVALVPAFLPRRKRGGRFKGDNHSGMREIERKPAVEYLLSNSWNTPPSNPVPLDRARNVPRKPPDFPLSADLIRVRKPHGPPCRIVVNRDSFGELGFGAALEFHRPSPGFGESSVVR